MDMRLNNSWSNWAQIDILLEKTIFWENWLILLFFIYCAPLGYYASKSNLRVAHIMWYKIFLFEAKLDTNHSFALAGDFFEKLTDVNFVYFMYSITILQCLT